MFVLCSPLGEDSHFDSCFFFKWVVQPTTSKDCHDDDDDDDDDYDDDDDD